MVHTPDRVYLSYLRDSEPPAFCQLLIPLSSQYCTLRSDHRSLFCCAHLRSSGTYNRYNSRSLFRNCVSDGIIFRDNNSSQENQIQMNAENILMMPNEIS